MAVKIETVLELRTFILKPLDLAGKWVAYSHIQLHPGLKNILHHIKASKEFVGFTENLFGLSKITQDSYLKTAARIWKIADYLFKQKVPYFSKPPHLFRWAGTFIHTISSLPPLFSALNPKTEQNFKPRLFSIVQNGSGLALALLEAPFIPRKSHQFIKLSLATISALCDLFDVKTPSKGA
jgi:hypothetical protein